MADQQPITEWTARQRARAILKFVGVAEDAQFRCEHGCAHTAIDFAEAQIAAQERDVASALREAP